MAINNNYDARPGATPLWQRAFSADATARWGQGGPAAGKNIRDIAFSMALNCLLKDGRESVEKRARLMYELLKINGFAAGREDDGINRAYAGLPTDNTFVKRVMKNLCTAYISPPERVFLDESGGPIRDSSLIEKILEECKLGYVLRKMHEMAKFTGECAVKVRARQGEIQLQIIDSGQYQTVKSDYGEILEFYKPFYEIVQNPVNNSTRAELRYEYWDRENFRVLDSQGAPVEFTHETFAYDEKKKSYRIAKNQALKNIRHGYGRIPVEILSFSANDNDGSGDEENLWPLAMAQLQLNAIDYMLQENAVYNAFSLWLFTNLDIKDDFRLSPGKALSAEQVSEETGIPPKAEIVSPKSFINELLSYKNSIMAQAMKNLGLPNSLIQDNPGLASGEAMKVDYRELENIRREDAALLKPFEQKLIKLILAVAARDPASRYQGIAPENVNTAVEYKELGAYQTEEQKREGLEARRAAGAISPSRYYSAYAGAGEKLSDEKAIEKMNENLRMFKKIGEI